MQRLRLWINPDKAEPEKKEALKQAAVEMSRAYDNLDQALNRLERTIRQDKQDRKKNHG